MAEDTKEYPATRQSESKVMPPPDPEVRFPDVAVIPAGQKAVIILPKDSPQKVQPMEIKFPKDIVTEDKEQPDGVKSVVNLPK